MLPPVWMPQESHNAEMKKRNQTLCSKWRWKLCLPTLDLQNVTWDLPLGALQLGLDNCGRTSHGESDAFEQRITNHSRLTLTLTRKSILCENFLFNKNKNWAKCCTQRKRFFLWNSTLRNVLLPSPLLSLSLSLSSFICLCLPPSLSGSTDFYIWGIGQFFLRAERLANVLQMQIHLPKEHCCKNIVLCLSKLQMIHLGARWEIET